MKPLPQASQLRFDAAVEIQDRIDALGGEAPPPTLVADVVQELRKGTSCSEEEVLAIISVLEVWFSSMAPAIEKLRESP